MFGRRRLPAASGSFELTPLDVDDYVVNGRGDPERAIAGLGVWPWMTDEVLDLIQWLRAYNRTHARKVHFVGIDMQVPDRALNEVLAYLRRSTCARRSIARRSSRSRSPSSWSCALAQGTRGAAVERHDNTLFASLSASCA